jgi:hypothetical protein
LNPGGGSGREEPPLGIQIPDDARELDRDLLAYRREQRIQRRRSRLGKLTAPFGGTGTVMPLLASILAVCLVAGAMLSVATFGPSTSANKSHPSAGAASSAPSAQHSSPQATASATQTASSSGSPAATAGTSHGAATTATGATATRAAATGATASEASPAGVRPLGSANSPAGSPGPAPARHAVSPTVP